MMMMMMMYRVSFYWTVLLAADGVVSWMN